ncbi:serine hydrolase [Pseudonocardia yuanmonensis]|uniref:serine hydrolase n=1 Tax=Pseudonocardia yuanmonensis TaxID=1095914 RepID=UPI0031ED24A8
MVLAAVAVLALAAAGCTDTATSSSAVPTSGTRSLLPQPPGPTARLGEQQVDTAVGQLDSIVQDAMSRTGVPGVAVAVVYRDQVVYSKGFGVREVGKPDAVDPDTVFQVASVSKPVASTIVAGVVGRKTIAWDDPVIKYNPSFSLRDPFVTANASFADLMSHRSGLYTGAGDLLEDLGFDQDYILPRLNQQPLDAFRASYNYSNFGYTEGGVAAADAAKQSWDALAQDTLFGPLGMTSSSYEHSVYESRPNKALIHVREDGANGATWQAKYLRDADAEAPAGGLSSSVRDMAQFIRLQLGAGKFGGTQVIDPAALQETHIPHQDLHTPQQPGARTQFYGLGWNVSYDDQGRLRLDHSGAFALGAATNVALLPVEQLGIVTFTNGYPIGVPEAVNNAFFDAAQNGRPTVDWLGFYGKALAASEEQPPNPYDTAPAHPKPPQALTAYTGTYDSPYYGPLTVAEGNGKLQITMGPPEKPTTFPLTAYDGDTFTFASIGENATGTSGAIFKPGPDGRIDGVTLTFYDQRGLGTFTRGA